MNNRNGPPSIIDDAINEAKGMAKDGMRHPSTKPVLTGAALGAAAAMLPFISLPVGIVGGAALVFFTRIKK